jgi:hypothetical protein
MGSLRDALDGGAFFLGESRVQDEGSHRWLCTRRMVIIIHDRLGEQRVRLVCKRCSHGHSPWGKGSLLHADMQAPIRGACAPKWNQHTASDHAPLTTHTLMQMRAGSTSIWLQCWRRRPTWHGP